VLELASSPAVVGRLLDAAGEPAGGLEGVFQVFLVDADGNELLSHDERFACRADGAFRLGCWSEPTMREKLQLVVQDERAGWLVHATPVFLAGEGHDLGTLSLEPLRALSFHVRDPSGAPIEGALAWVDGPSARRRAPLTGADGRGVLALCPDREADVRFAALGYEDLVVRVVPGDEPEVVLEPLTLVEVRFLGSTAADARRLRISADAPALPWSDEAQTRVELGGLAFAGWRGPEKTGGRHEVELSVTPGGPVRLSALSPGLPLTLEALDDAGRVLDSGTLSLAPGERATLVLGREDGGGPPPPQRASAPVEVRRSR
jgi:hypothetical protein